MTCLHPRARTLLVLLVASSIFATGRPARAAEHPTVGDPAKSNCALCHEDLTEAKSVIHPPTVDDCLMCHDFTVDESGSSVQLTEQDPDLCVMCHDDQAAAAGLELAVPHYPVGDSCRSCHEPHAADQENLLRIESPGLCLECHDGDDVNQAHPVPVSRADCVDCHSPHGTDVRGMLLSDRSHVPFAEGSCLACHRKPRGTKVSLRTQLPELCFACHSDLEVVTTKSGAHQPARDGDCTVCHSPHLSPNESLLHQEAEPLCERCHTAIFEQTRAPVPHAAIESGCTSCHDPHRSDQSKLLVQATAELCAECHDLSDGDLQGLHLGSDFAGTKCTECHAPHGSTQENLLAEGSLHPPFADGCDTCHDGAFDTFVESGSALCTACHSDIESVITDAAVPHAAMEVGSCTDCHSPHASSTKTLLRGSGGQVCFECHDDKRADPDEHQHRIIDWAGCQTCHAPHGGDGVALLKKSGNQLCEGCHLEVLVQPDEEGSIHLEGGLTLQGERAASLPVIGLNADRLLDHPSPRHPVAGTMSSDEESNLAEEVQGKELSCLSCHDPHKGVSTLLLAGGAATKSQLCLDCHPK